MSAGRPRVVLLRGHNANVWELRVWERLTDEFDVRVLVTGSNLHEVGDLDLDVVEVATPRDVLPVGRVAGAAAYVLGERYRGLDGQLAGADIVHAAELGTWFSAQAAALKPQAGFRLVLTVWETLAWRETWRWPRERGYRRRVLGALDLCVAATRRARDGLRLEGVPPERIAISAPGVDLERFAAGEARPGAQHVVLSAGRLVWEKGHQDAIRALAALRGWIVGPARDDVRLLVVGAGPEERKLRRYAGELGLGAAVEFRVRVPYDEMPGVHRSASALVLASLPTRAWEEQFGMVLAEAMAAGTPIVACDTGAIPEVLAGQGALVPAGDWRGIAEALSAGPLAAAPGTRAAYDAAHLREFSADAAAERTRAAYRRVLGLPA
jgi:glycosyltransferase involved in cell wall biosynthesis